MKIFTSPQIRAWDKYTITNEPISSVDLMERASLAFATRFLALEGTAQKILIFCGPGNNGGDGLAIGRLLLKNGYKVSVFTCTADRGLSNDALVHRELLNSLQSINSISSIADFPVIQKNYIVIDALFGTGVSRPLEGIFLDLVRYINQSLAKVYAVDIASGLYSDSPLPSEAHCIKPTVTLTFQCPKLALLLPENEEYVRKWEILDIGLSPTFSESENTPYFLTTGLEARKLLKLRGKFSHKGTHGHSLLWAGSYGKIGAALLAAKSALRAGAGLVTAHIPRCGYEIFQTSLPDAMVEIDQGDHELMDTKHSLNGYKAIGIGPGIGQHMATEKAMTSIFTSTSLPLVIDADALNILGRRQELFRYIPAQSILTPHPKEFERLSLQTAANSYERLQILLEFCLKKNVITVLKGAHTVIATPEGELYFNTTGNPGMAKAGMGDVLTGIITGLISQGYSPKDAAILGVYIHGKTADILVEKTGPYSLLASDVADNLGLAFLTLM